MAMVVNTAEPGSGCWGSDGTGSWLVTVDGDQGPDEVTDEIMKVVHERGLA